MLLTNKIISTVARGRILGGVRGGAHLPGDDFAPLLKCSAPPLIIIINEINIKRLKDNYTSLIK